MKKSVGLGLRHSFHKHVLDTKPLVPWFEIITENYLFFDGSPRAFLNKIRADYPLVFHGVSLSIGSLIPPSREYLTQLKKMIHEFNPLWVSDHLCWTYNGTENSHDLLPVPFTRESLKRISQKVQLVQDFLGQKIYLENPSAYVDFAQNEYSEADFIQELCKSSGCGLLLDLNNLVVNQYNLGYSPLHYLDKIKNCEVRQIHLAGHTVKEQVRIDTHDSDISQEVLDLLPVAKKLWPDANPMLEWDDKIPTFEYLFEQKNKIQDLWNLPIFYSLDLGPQPFTQNSVNNKKDQHLHQVFWNILKKNDYVTMADTSKAEIFNQNCPTPANVGMNVYSSAYYNRLIEVLGKDFPVLKTVLNELFNDVIMEYLITYPSKYDSIDFVGNNLAKFITEHNFNYSLGAHRKVISDVAAFENLSGLCSIVFSDNLPTLSVRDFTEHEWANKKIKLKSTALLLQTNSKIHPVIDAVKKNEIPEIPELTTCYYLFYRENNETQYRLLSEDEFYFLNQFLAAKPFTDTISDDGSNLQKNSQLLFNNEKFLCCIVL